MKTLVFENKALNGGFTQIPNSILYDNSISQSARFLYTVLLSFAWTQDQVFPGQDRLVDILSCSKRSVRTYLIELKEKKLISWKQRGLNKTNIYTISDWNDTYQAGAATIAVQERQPLPFKNGTKLPTKNTKVNKTEREREKFSLSVFFEEHRGIEKEFDVKFTALQRAAQKYSLFCDDKDRSLSESGLRLWLSREKWEYEDRSIKKQNELDKQAIMEGFMS